MRTQGIDYGLGRSNVSKETGIRFGVCQTNRLDSLIESMEPEYGPAICNKCEAESSDVGDMDKHDDCDGMWRYAEEPLGYSYDRDGYKLTDCLDSDTMVLASPYYTYAPFCSPCVPGAGNLDDAPTIAEYNSDPDAYSSWARVLCLGPDWHEDESAPSYPIWEVATSNRIA